MKARYYLKLLAPLCVFAFAFRILEIIFAIDSANGFYVNGSVIPVLFNIYILIASLFLLSSVIFTKREQKPVRGRVATLGKAGNFTALIAAVFILAGEMQPLLHNILNLNKYASVADILGDTAIYRLVFAVFIALFLVHIASNPKKAIKNRFYIFISVFCPVYYVFRAVLLFTDLSQILTSAYSVYDMILLLMLAVAYMNLSKILAGSRGKRLITGFGMTSVLFGVIRLADIIMHFIPGDPYNVKVTVLANIADVLAAFLMLFIVMRINRKSQKPDGKSAEFEPVNQ